jgi:hypothetical protein
MTTDEAVTKRHELLAQARQAELAGAHDIAERCRTLATNCGLIAFGDPETQERGRLWYGKNKADMEKYLSERAEHRKAV